ncbi:MAG TPA: hypothetical protein VG074_15030 [Acidimicrobiales bacterium]|jgi:hypothetical protein|nr:hypothetical protein [Acidimicrobiales bacterium]
MAKFFSLASLVVVGIIIADIVTHGSQFAQAASGFSSIENPAIGGLLGKAP